MYKVFIYDKPVYITSDPNFEVKNCQQFTEVNVDKILSYLEKKDVEAGIIQCEDEKQTWKKFKKHFHFIEAAGGAVLNESDELLIIHRLGKWDLPKGKREKGEGIEACALREIEEECNVNGLSIISPLNSTYHCYPYKDKWALKRTYWFKVSTHFKGELIPQTEEGIEQVIWLPQKKIETIYNDTYRSILEVLQQV